MRCLPALVAGVLSAGVVPALPAAGASPAANPGPGAELRAASDPASVLRRFVGVWNATLQIATASDSPPIVLNGLSVETPGGDGAWVTGDFRSTLDGQPFQGHELVTWDALRGHFRRVWADSTAPTFWTSEGTYDPVTSTLTLWIDTIDSSGHPARWREETVFKDADTRTFTMYVPGPETREAAAMTIVYHRRPGGDPSRPPDAAAPASKPLEVLSASAGRFEARIEARAGAAGRDQARGAETAGLCCGGRFLVSDLSAPAGGGFAAHEVIGYDPSSSSYVAAWIDARDKALVLARGPYDPKAGVLTLREDPPRAGGQGWREVQEWSGRDHRSLLRYAPGSGGAQAPAWSVKYRRSD